MIKSKTLNIFQFLIFHTVVLTKIFTQTIISGNASYFNPETQNIEPIRHAFILVNTEYPVIIREGYTDENGNYSFSIGNAYPEMVTVRLYFKNEKVDLRGFEGTRVDFVQHAKVIRISDGTPDIVPNQFHLPGSEFIGMNFYYGANSTWAGYAWAFSMANLAAEFAFTSGITNEQVVVKFPLETTLTDGLGNLESAYDINSFFWPYETKSLDGGDILPFLPLLGTFLLTGGVEAQLTKNTIYIDNDSDRLTIFHEYGHFIMKEMREGTWPISLNEYLNGYETMTHSWNEYNQSERLAFIEGWANFFAAAVESFNNNSNDTYSGSYGEGPVDLFENTHHINYYKFNFNNVENGFKNEVTVGAAFFDLYDPENSGDNDGLQLTLGNISESFNKNIFTFNDYLFSLYPSLINSEREKLVIILKTLKMPYTHLPDLPLIAPWNLQISNYGQINHNPILIWESFEDTDFSNYEIYRKMSYLNSDSWNLIGSPTDTQFTDLEVIMKPFEDAYDQFIYYVLAIDDNGSRSGRSNYVSTWGETFYKLTNINKMIDPVIPANIELAQNYPNPFNPITTIQYSLPKDSQVRIDIYNLKGQLVKTLVNQSQPAGYHTVSWNIKDNAREEIAAGIYLYQIVTSEFTDTKKLVVMK